jgi:hypothetical protein
MLLPFARITIVAFVRRQILVDRAEAAEIDGVKSSAKRTATSRLWQVDFTFEGRPLRGLGAEPQYEVAMGPTSALR